MCITYSYVSSGSLESSKTVAVDPGTSTTSSFLRASTCEYSKLLHCLVCAQVYSMKWNTMFNSVSCIIIVGKQELANLVVQLVQHDFSIH